MNEPSEKDFLQYKGHHIPRVIRLVWTLLIAFGAAYLIRFALPDLKSWL